jgi:hypothetical protein
MREAVPEELWGMRLGVVTLDLARGWQAKAAGLQGAEDRVGKAMR